MTLWQYERMENDKLGMLWMYKNQNPKERNRKWKQADYKNEWFHAEMDENAKREQEERHDFMRVMKKIEESAIMEQEERKKMRERFKIIIEQNKLLADILDNIKSDIEEKIEQKMTHRVEDLLRKVKGEIEGRYRREDKCHYSGNGGRRRF